MDKKFWDKVKNSLRQKNPENKLLETWFEPVEFIEAVKGDSGLRFRLGVPTELHRYWISQNFLDRICSEISALYNLPYEVELVITGQKEDSFENPYVTQYSVNDLNAGGLVENKSAVVEKNKDILNELYTFNTFVVGRNNEFAHAASYSVAQNPASGYNPLFICGPTGMGKTHLLNAIGNTIREKFSHFTICYVSAERFLNECISGIRRQEMDKFRRRYRDKCDILLMDDIQILGRGDAVQEEFFHTLNNFFESGKQVVVASDRMPKDIKGLEDRIRTRLEWGLIADIQMPDMETRVAILRYKAENRSLNIPDDVINYIAQISKRSIRELEGNLNKVKMFTELQGLPITLDLAKRVLATHFTDSGNLTLEDIQRISAEHFKVRLNDLKSSNRSKPIVTARQVAMLLVKKHLNKSLKDIGRAFGGKDHTTVINAIRRIESQQSKNTDLRRDIEEIEGRIHNITGV